MESRSEVVKGSAHSEPRTLCIMRCTEHGHEIADSSMSHMNAEPDVPKSPKTSWHYDKSQVWQFAVTQAASVSSTTTTTRPKNPTGQSKSFFWAVHRTTSSTLDSCGIVLVPCFRVVNLRGDSLPMSVSVLVTALRYHAKQLDDGCNLQSEYCALFGFFVHNVHIPAITFTPLTVYYTHPMGLSRPSKLTMIL